MWGFCDQLARRRGRCSIFDSIWSWSKSSASFAPYFLAWLLWMVVGTIFYAKVNFGGNFAHGFYYSVNVGYSVGWSGLTDYNNASKAFSIVYLLIGAIFLTRWLVYLVESAVQERPHLEDNNIPAIQSEGQSIFCISLPNFVRYVKSNNKKLLIVYIWIVYVLFGAFWSCHEIGWSFLDGLYFALSSLSTGGMWSIPLYSKDYIYACVGLYTCLGVPIMGMAMGNIATLMFESRQLSSSMSHANIGDQAFQAVQSQEDTEASFQELSIEEDQMDMSTLLSIPRGDRKVTTPFLPAIRGNSAEVQKKEKSRSNFSNAYEYIISMLKNEGKLSNEDIIRMHQDFENKRLCDLSPLRIQLPVSRSTSKGISTATFPKNPKFTAVKAPINSSTISIVVQVPTITTVSDTEVFAAHSTPEISL